jgi:predicted AlkP superfamily phosphohydrolase/phosphomutase
VKEKSTSGNHSKVVVIGLDGATFDIIDPLIAKGRMPNLHSIIKRGVRGDLESTIPPLSPVAWTSFMTGTKPGKHGIFDFLSSKPGSYQFQAINATSRKAEPIWKIVSKTGKKVGVVNVPMTYPADKVNGFMIAGLDSPTVKSKFTFEPPELYSEIMEKIGNYIINQDIVINSKSDNPRYFQGIVDMIENQTAAVKYLMKTRDMDLLIYVSTATDFIQHGSWKYIEENHPDYREELHEKYGSDIYKIYEKMDNVLGEIIKNIDPETTIIIMSDHGQGPLYKFFSLNDWLRKEGYFHVNLGYQRNAKYRVLTHLRKLVDNLFLGLGMNSGYETIQKITGRFRGKITSVISSLYTNNIDWNRTTAFCEGSYPAIFINLQGKYPNGRVKHGEEYEKLRDEIISKLKGFKDPHTGEEIVDEIYKTEEIYPGEVNGTPPDLICALKDGYHGGGRAEQLYLGLDENKLFCSHRWSGQHRMNGIFIAAGPSIRANTTISNAHIVDIAPTILYQMGLPIPLVMDGKVLEEIFASEYLRSNEKRFSERTEYDEKGEEVQVLSDEDSELVKNRLRDLGYIE